MSLFISNLYPQTIWLAFAYYDPSCGNENQNFRKQGWWQFDPQTNPGVAQFGVDWWKVDLKTVNRYAYFFAGSLDGATWGGTGNAWLDLTKNKFSQCAFDNSGDDWWVDFGELDFRLASINPPNPEPWDAWNLTVYIGPNAGEWQASHWPL